MPCSGGEVLCLAVVLWRLHTTESAYTYLTENSCVQNVLLLQQKKKKKKGFTVENIT